MALTLLLLPLLLGTTAPTWPAARPGPIGQVTTATSSSYSGESPCNINLTDGQFSSQWANASAGAIIGASLFPVGSNNSERDILWGKVCNSPTDIFFVVDLQAEPTNASWYRIWIDTTGSGIRDYDIVFATWGLEVWNYSATLYTCYLGPGPVCDRQLPTGCTCWEVGVPLSLLGDPNSLRWRADTRTSTDVLIDTVPTPPAWSSDYYILSPPPVAAKTPVYEDPVVLVSLSSAASFAVLAGFLVTNESWRDAIMAVPPALYARLGRTKALDHFLRGRIYQSVQEHPGITYSELKRMMGVANGVLTYHLHYLEMTGFLYSRRDRKWKQFYADSSPSVQGDRYLSHMQRRLLELTVGEPGLGYAEAANRIGATKWQVMYNAKRLAEDGLLVLRRNGIAVHCYPASPLGPLKTDRGPRSRSETEPALPPTPQPTPKRVFSGEGSVSRAAESPASDGGPPPQK